MQLEKREHIGQFGSLRDSMARALQDPSALLVSRNTYHDITGTIEKRPGYEFHAEVADQVEATCAPVLTATTGGNLKNSVLYYLRYTYVTAAGETDDLHSGDTASPGPAMASVEMTGGNNAITTEVPFHMRGVTIAAHEVIDDTTSRFTIDQTINTLAADTCIVGWLVYSRAPGVQDETHLGHNCAVTEPLYHRNEQMPNGLLGRVTAYDSGTGYITIDSPLEVGNSDIPAYNQLDIMMPDRNGMPVKYYNVYISSDNQNFYYGTTGITGLGSVTVTDHDTTAKRAPSTRISREAPTVTAVDYTEDPRDGRCGEWPVLTGIDAGMYQVRITYHTDDSEEIRPPGLELAQQLLDEDEYCYPMKCRQESWPSCRAIVCVEDGQGIQVVPNNMPDDLSYTDWRIYCGMIEPVGELTMENGVRNGDLDIADDNERPYSWYYPDRDFGASDPLVTALWPTLDDFAPMGSGNGLPDESGASNSQVFEELRSGPPNFTVSPSADPYEGGAYNLNTTSYEDVHNIFDPEGDQIFTYGSSRADAYANRFDFNFWMQQDASYATATHAIVGIRIRINPNSPNGYFRPSYTGVDDYIRVSYWDYNASTPAGVTLKNSDWKVDGNFHTYYFCVDDPNSLTNSFAAENYFSLMVRSIGGIQFDIEDTWMWLYNIEGFCSAAHEHSSDERGVYGAQAGGGEPDLFGAWYSGDTDLADAAIEAAITTASIEALTPVNYRNTPYEEYGPSFSVSPGSNLPGTAFEPFSGSITMGSAGAGQMYAAHLPANYPGIQYSQFSIDGETNGVNYTLNRYTGLITSIDILDGEVLTVNYDLPVESWTASNDEADITEGWAPTYMDIHREIIDSKRPDYEWSPLWASSRQDVKVNQHLWWFQCNDLPADPAYIRLEIRFRTRDGGSGGLGAWAAGADNNRKICLWDDAGSAWIDLELDIGGADLLDTWVTKSYAIPWQDIRLTQALTENFTGNFPYFIARMAGDDYNGFDVDYVRVFVDTEHEDPIPGKDELLRDKVDYGTTTWTLRNPMLEKPIVSSTASHCPVEEYMPIQGEWCPIRRNTTGQWPVVVASMPTVKGAGTSADRLDNYIGCGDSVFVDRGDGNLDRIYHAEDRYHGKVMANDWEFCNYLTRVFFCNPGDPKYNYRFDGVQTHPHGIAWPSKWDEDRDESGNYNPPGDEDDEQDPNDPDCFKVGEQPLGTIIDVSQIDTPDGEVPEGDDTLTPVSCHDVEYYIQWVRILKTGGRSYIVRSRPRLLTETVEICIHPSFLPTVKIEADMCPEPQVTHIEIYRNYSFTARYFRVDRIPVDEAKIDTETGRLKFKFEDTIPEADEDLTNPMILETGRPRAARMFKFHQGRVWSVPQAAGLVVDFTNVVDTAGNIDPEGWWPLHYLIPPMRESAAITCLSPYQNSLVAHSRQGMCSIRGVSQNQNDPSAIVSTAMYAHAGFVGPHAWTVMDSALVGITHEGPALVIGDEAKIFGTEDIDMEDFLWDGDTSYSTRCIHYRSKGISQVWFTYTDDPMVAPGNKALVFDRSSDDTNPGAVYWKKWDDLPGYGVSLARGLCGDEYPLIGGCDGRLYDFGSVGTDCGLFIEAEFQTGWYDELDGGKSHQPDVTYWRVDGHIDEVAFLDIRKDGVGQVLDTEGIPIRMGGTISTTEDLSDEAHLRRRWDGSGMWNDGGIWREKDKDYDETRTHHRGVMRSIQYRVYHSRALVPAGIDMSNSFRITGFIPFHRPHAPTQASARV
jgi:hypothetical protein